MKIETRFDIGDEVSLGKQYGTIIRIIIEESESDLEIFYQIQKQGGGICTRLENCLRRIGRR